jgi:tryptophan-rich sensory protein
MQGARFRVAFAPSRIGLLLASRRRMTRSASLRRFDGEHPLIAWFHPAPWLAVVAVAVLAGVATGPNAWYAELQKPALQPPNWAFGPAWTVLYALIALATSRVLGAPKSRARRVALVLFGVNLALNFAWSFLFFSFGSVLFAAIEITFVFATACAMVVAYARLSPLAASLLVPYVLWLGFATYLNFGILALN